MPTNDFKAIAGSGGANVLTQADFEALATTIANGLSGGIVPSNLFNKLFRQSSAIAAGVAQYIVDLSGDNVLDDGDAAALLASLKKALAAQIDAQSGNYVADTGVANAYVVALDPPVTAYTNGLTVRFRVAHANTGASTLNAGAGAVDIRNDVDGALVANDLPVNSIATATYVAALGRFNMTSLVPSQALSQAAADARYASLNYAQQIKPIAASVAANALTVTLNPTSLDFRSATLNSGGVNTRSIPSAISITLPSGASLGLGSGNTGRLVVLAIDNAGTVELAVVNLSGSIKLDETNLISTTAISSAATGDSIVYSTTARANVPYRVVGFVEVTEAASGVYATAPSIVQGCGGQALAALSSIGYGQTPQDVTASRAINTTYYNLTGRPISISVIASIAYTGSSTTPVLKAVLRGVDVDGWNSNTSQTNVQTLKIPVIPPGHSYSISGTGTILKWSELS